MFIEIITFILILVIQLSVGFYAYTSRKRISKRYSKGLSSQIELSETLESLMSVLNKFDIKVKVLKNLDVPALSKNGVLYINKDSIYRTDLYTNYKAIYEVVTLTNFFIFNILPKIQILLYILSIFLIIFGSFLQSQLGDDLIRLAIGIQLSLIAFSYLIYIFSDKVFKKMQYYAYKILNMDDVELARSVSLNKELRLTPFEYAMRPFVGIIEFFGK